MTSLTMTYTDLLPRIDAIKSLFGTDVEVVLIDEHPPFHLAEALHEPENAAPWFSATVEGIKCVLVVDWRMTPDDPEPYQRYATVAREVLTKLPTDALRTQWRKHLVDMSRAFKQRAAYHRGSEKSYESTADNILNMLNETAVMPPAANDSVH